MTTELAHSYYLETIRGQPLKKGRSLPPPEKLPPLVRVDCGLGCVLQAGWSLSSGPGRIIAFNYMVDYQLLVSMGEHVCVCA
jgi:hypothetical protein